MSYEISMMPAGTDASQLPEHVFVLLQEDEGYAAIASVQAERPVAGTLYLEARREGNRLLYDLERYYVPEGRGNPRGTMRAEIAVQDGHARIKQLFVDDQPWK